MSGFSLRGAVCAAGLTDSLQTSLFFPFLDLRVSCKVPLPTPIPCMPSLGSLPLKQTFCCLTCARMQTEEQKAAARNKSILITKKKKETTGPLNRAVFFNFFFFNFEALSVFSSFPAMFNILKLSKVSKVVCFCFCYSHKGPWASCWAASTASPASCSSPPTGTSSSWTRLRGTTTRTCTASSASSSR